jgi:hypothetical protein
MPDFNGTPMTKREVLIAREAYARRSRETYTTGEWERSIRGLVEAEAAAAYPLPTVTRPRVVKDPCSSKLEWTVEDGYLRCREGGGWMKWAGYKLYSDFAPLPARVAVWAALLANPTETVEDDA